MENKETKNGLHVMFERWNQSKVSQPRDIAREVGKELGVIKNSRQRYRARRKEEFLRKKRGEHICYMLEGYNHLLSGDHIVKSELGDQHFIVIPREGGDRE